jgi:hypothetical protein
VRGSRAQTGAYHRGAKLATQGERRKLPSNTNHTALVFHWKYDRPRVSHITTGDRPRTGALGLLCSCCWLNWKRPIQGPSTNLPSVGEQERPMLPSPVQDHVGRIPHASLEICAQSGLGHAWCGSGVLGPRGSLALAVISLVQEHDRSETRGCCLGRDFDSLKSGQLTSVFSLGLTRRGRLGTHLRLLFEA